MAGHIMLPVFSVGSSTRLLPLLCPTVPLNSVLKYGFVSPKYFSSSLRESHWVIFIGDCKLTVKSWASWALCISFCPCEANPEGLSPSFSKSCNWGFSSPDLLISLLLEGIHELNTKYWCWSRDSWVILYGLFYTGAQKR